MSDIHLALMAGLAASNADARASDFPTQPIRIILPGSPGGTFDALAHLLAEGLQAQLKQPAIVETWPADAAFLAADLVARAKPDGHTILMGTAGLAMLPLLQKGLSYQPAHLRPLAISLLTPHVLVAGATKPELASLAELIAYGKANPGKLSAGSAETTGLFASLLFQSASGIEALQVRHTGSTPLIAGVVAGHVDFALLGGASLMPPAQVDRLRLLAVTSDQRLPAIPDVPTLAELGVKSAAIEAWSGLMVPRGTDPAVVRVLERAIENVTTSQTYVKKAGEIGAIPCFIGSQAAAQFIADDLKVKERLAAQAGIKPE